jgi:hypothetical protein
LATWQLLPQIEQRVGQIYMFSWETHHRYLWEDTHLVDQLSQELVRHPNPEQNYEICSAINLTLLLKIRGQFKSHHEG